MYRNLLVKSVRGVRWVSSLENENHYILHIDNVVSSMRSVHPVSKQDIIHYV